MGFQPNYQSEGRIYAKYILEHFPNSKIAVLWQNDDAGKDQFKGLRDGLGDKANMIIADKSYEVSDPSINSQIVALRDSGADIFFSWAAPKGSAQAIRKVGELGWKPKFFLANTATSVAAVLKPAGLEYAKGIISTAYLKDPTDPTWKDDRPDQDVARLHGQVLSRRRQDQRQQRSMAMSQAQAMVQVLKQCGDDLTRENVMKQAASLKNFHSDMMLPGIMVNTSPDDYFPIEQMQLMQFNGEAWELFGEVITGEVGHELEPLRKLARLGSWSRRRQRDDGISGFAISGAQSRMPAMSILRIGLFSIF